jgi:hypothetical protein
MGSPVIVLTGTIRPNVDFVARAGVDSRLKDYINSIKFYLESTSCKIVFAENSGYDLPSSPDFIPLLDHARFHWQPVKAHADLSRGKGFQEFFALDQIVDAGLAGDYFVKITGRYLVRNVAELMHRLSAPMHIDLHRKMGVAITGFFGVSTRFYRAHLYGKYALANDASGYFIEHVVYDTIKSKKLNKQVELLPANAAYEGISGSHGNSMARNPYKMKLRSIERTINRSLGIHKFLIEY